MWYFLKLSIIALYLPGVERPLSPRRAGWAQVVSALRRAVPATAEEVVQALQGAGLSEEAATLAAPGVLSRSESLLRSASPLTVVDPEYPCRWRERLGAAAPPALWCQGTVPVGDTVTIVGSRDVSPSVRAFCRECAEHVAAAGGVIVSGRAAGCDRAAAEGADGLIEVVPYGLQHLEGSVREGSAVLSAVPPFASFSTPAAMERNALLYAASDAAIVGHARLREGGTWHGATDALRKRRTTLLVRDGREEPSHRALVALGGRWLASAAELPDALAAAPAQASLFSAAG